MRGAFAHLPNGQRLLAAFTQAIKLALSSALHDVFVVGVVIAAIAAVGTLFLKEIPLQGRAERAAEAAEQAA